MAICLCDPLYLKVFKLSSASFFNFLPSSLTLSIILMLSVSLDLDFTSSIAFLSITARAFFRSCNKFL